MVQLNNVTRRFLITRIFCTFPVQFNDKTRKFENHPFKWFYTICLTNITFLLFGTSAFLIFKTEIRTGKDTLRLSLKISQLMIAFIIIATCCWIREKLADTANGYMEIDTLLLENGAQIDLKLLKYLLLTKHGMVFVLISLSNGACFTLHDNYLECATYIFVYNLTYIISSLISTSVCAFVGIALMRLLVLNRSAANIALKGRTDTLNKKPMIPLNIYHPDKTMRTITITHFKIIKVANKLNQTYSFQIILMIYKSLIQILESMHYILSNETGLPIFSDLFWSYATLVEVLVLLVLTTRLDAKTKETARIVNMIATGNNPFLQLEKNMFLLQSKHHKLCLTACRLFPLNTNMFLSLCGMTLTYLIIIQDPNNIN